MFLVVSLYVDTNTKGPLSTPCPYSMDGLQELVIKRSLPVLEVWGETPSPNHTRLLKKWDSGGYLPEAWLYELYSRTGWLGVGR